jgi:hypothetical protein
MRTKQLAKVEFDILKCIEQNHDSIQEQSSIIEELADKRLIDIATQAMKEKMKINREKGRGGWWRESECSIRTLNNMLKDHIDKGDDMRDIMILSAMIYVRELIDEE